MQFQSQVRIRHHKAGESDGSREHYWRDVLHFAGAYPARRQTRVRTIIAIVIIAVVGTVVVPTVSAQQSRTRVEFPGITDTDIRATVNQLMQVVATYRVTMPPNEDQRSQWLNGTIWTDQGTATENLSVSVNGRHDNKVGPPPEPTQHPN